MKKDQVIVAVFLLFAVVYIAFFSRRETKVDGDRVHVQTPQAVTTLQKAGSFEEKVYLVVGMGLNRNDYYDAQIPAIPMGTVEALNSQYGDFRKCTSPGAEAGKQSMVHVRLVGMGDNARKGISAVYERSKRLEDFVIRVSAAPANMLEHQLRSNRARLLMDPGHEDLLVNDVEIVSSGK